MATSEEILQRYFGYTQFRFDQKKIIETVVNGQDSLAILPTGGGKSVCYQIPGLLLGGTTLVISPLISLMKDQVDQLQRRGISAAFLNSTLSKEESDHFFELFSNGRLQFVYVAPERLHSQKFLGICKNLFIPLIAVDEAHCVSQWGHDFRPSYLQIHAFIKQFTKRPRVLALTATATDKVKDEIVVFTGLRSLAIFQSSFKRSNLSIFQKNCLSESEKVLRLIKIFLECKGQKILIYCATRAQTVHYAELARKFGFICNYYHAGLPPESKNQIQSEFTEGVLKIITATNAFGMGIDIPDIRVVIHLQLPQNIEGYYQEIGRAGRDGKESFCYLFHTKHDLQVANHIFVKNYPEVSDVETTLLYLISQNAQNKPFPIKKLKEKKILYTLHLLEKLNYLKKVGVHNKEAVQLLSTDWTGIKKWQNERITKVAQKESVLNIFTSEKCRSLEILQYFGEQTREICQKCDICLPNFCEISDIEKKMRTVLWQKIQSNRQKSTTTFPSFISTQQVKFLVLKKLFHESEAFFIPGIGKGHQQYLKL